LFHILPLHFYYLSPAKTYSFYYCNKQNATIAVKNSTELNSYALRLCNSLAKFVALALCAYEGM